VELRWRDQQGLYNEKKRARTKREKMQEWLYRVSTQIDIIESWHTACTKNADNNSKHLPEQYHFLLKKL
jgi:hypothetical protein